MLKLLSLSLFTTQNFGMWGFCCRFFCILRTPQSGWWTSEKVWTKFFLKSLVTLPRPCCGEWTSSVANPNVMGGTNWKGSGILFFSGHYLSANLNACSTFQIVARTPDVCSEKCFPFTCFLTRSWSGQINPEFFPLILWEISWDLTTPVKYVNLNV